MIIGAATAKRLAAEGAKIIVNFAKNAEAANQVVQAIKQSGGEAITIAADLSDPKLQYAITLYRREIERLYGILDRRLSEREYLIGQDYTILDISTFGWVNLHSCVLGEIDQFPHLQRWLAQLNALSRMGGNWYGQVTAESMFELS